MESLNQPPQSQEVQGQMPSPVNNSSGSKLIPIILGVAAAIVIAIGAYVLGTKQTQPVVQNVVQTTPIPSPISTQFLDKKEVGIFSSQNYLKRHFDLNEKFFNTQKYPSEITNINENNLVGIRCTRLYNYFTGENFYYYDDVSEKRIRLQDTHFLKLIKEVYKTIPNKTIASAQACEKENNTYILMYGVALPVGGGGNDTYLASFNSTDSIQQIVEIKSEDLAYFGCGNILQLTKMGIVYISCGIGISESIYSVDFNKKSPNRIIRCEYLFDSSKNEYSDKFSCS